MDAGAILTPAEANPFSPGFGRTPHSLVGRDDLLADLGGGLAAGSRDPRYASLLMGVRGSGKTVVLNELEDRAARQGWVILSADGSSRGLPERIVNVIAVTRGDSASIGAAAGPQKGSRLQSFGLRLGVLSATWHAGDDQPQRPRAGMGDALASLAHAAAQAGTSVLLTVDELHAVDREEARRLSSDIQHIAGRAGLPLAFVGAGLLEMRYTLLADTKITFMQRCERYEMNSLKEADVAVGDGSPDPRRRRRHHTRSAAGRHPFRRRIRPRPLQASDPRTHHVADGGRPGSDDRHASRRTVAARRRGSGSPQHLCSPPGTNCRMPPSRTSRRLRSALATPRRASSPARSPSAPACRRGERRTYGGTSCWRDTWLRDPAVRSVSPIWFRLRSCGKRLRRN